MFSDLRQRAKKVNQPPGTAIYTGDSSHETHITIMHYGQTQCSIKEDATLEDCIADGAEVSWIHVDGFHNVDLIKSICDKFQIHPLVVEDILNVSQRPKLDDYDNYSFVTLKSLLWTEKKQILSVEQLSIVFNDRFVLSFQDFPSLVAADIRNRFQKANAQRVLKNGTDYLVYRLLDATIDNYFIVLEEIGDKIEDIEDVIMEEPTEKNAKLIYHLKRQMLTLRKVIWPMREVLSHLSYGESSLVSASTRLYIRDAYDHISQAIDTVETFRDILASLLDMYLSGLTVRTNDIIKTLTIITTIFIPITAIASIYGMNMAGIPFMKSRWAFTIVASIMGAGIVWMLVYFRRKKWL